MFIVNAEAPNGSRVAPYTYSVFAGRFETYDEAKEAVTSIKGATQISILEPGVRRESWSFNLKTKKWSHKIREAKQTN